MTDTDRLADFPRIVIVPTRDGGFVVFGMNDDIYVFVSKAKLLDWLKEQLA